MQSSLRSFSGPRIKYTPDDSPYESITVDKLTPIIGGEIGGVDLRAPSNRQMDEIHRALAENLVIFFRDQHLSQEQHLDFGRKFGELHLHPAAPSEPGRPELMVIHADKDSFRANGEGWHSDVSCDPEPPMGSILYIRKCPPRATASCATSTSPWPTRCSSAASAGRRTQSRSGTTAASSITRCGITGRTPARVTGSPSRATGRFSSAFWRRRPCSSPYACR